MSLLILFGGAAPGVAAPATWTYGGDDDGDPQVEATYDGDADTTCSYGGD